MNFFTRLNNQIRSYILLTMLVTMAFTGLGFWLSFQFLDYPPLGYTVVVFGSVGLAVWAAHVLTKFVLMPLGFVWQALVYLAPQNTGTPAPDLKSVKIGHELVNSMVMQIYQLGSNIPKGKEPAVTDNMSATITRTFPLPIIALSPNLNIVFANDAALQYMGQTSENVIGKNIYSVVNLAFANEHTFESWLQDSRAHRATSSDSWHRVRFNLNDDKHTLRQFDMAGSYNKDEPNGAETILTIFDRTTDYDQDDDGLSFVALAVHELRTPLTVLRGFIEVFEDELGDSLDDEMRDFMHKMKVSAQQLSGFVNNILNVARIEDDQLELQLTEQSWPQIIKESIENMRLRMQVHGKAVELQVAPNLPTVAVDKISIYEVMSNLIDNAMKYSGNSKKIVISCLLNKDGLVETSVQDFGVGVPSSVMPHLFEKFQRNHRNRSQIGGTGLGLYLSKAIIAAHGGNIWVQSKENEGSKFSFTVKPYSLLAQELKNSDNKEITRSAHGWIKNHSMLRQ